MDNQIYPVSQDDLQQEAEAIKRLLPPMNEVGGFGDNSQLLFDDLLVETEEFPRSSEEAVEDTADILNGEAPFVAIDYSVTDRFSGKQVQYQYLEVYAGGIWEFNFTYLAGTGSAEQGLSNPHNSLMFRRTSYADMSDEQFRGEMITIAKMGWSGRIKQVVSYDANKRYYGASLYYEQSPGVFYLLQTMMNPGSIDLKSPGAGTLTVEGEVDIDGKHDTSIIFDRRFVARQRLVKDGRSLSLPVTEKDADKSRKLDRKNQAATYVILLIVAASIMGAVYILRGVL